MNELEGLVVGKTDMKFFPTTLIVSGFLITATFFAGPVNASQAAPRIIAEVKQRGMIVAAPIRIDLLKAVPGGVTFIVNSPLDEPDYMPGDGVCLSTPSDKCTLRAATMEADSIEGADTIMLPAGWYQITQLNPYDDPAGGDLDVHDSLTIIGAGSSSTFIDGNGSVTDDRVFEITGYSVFVSISGVTIQNGQSDQGGGILINDGALSLTNSTVGGNAGQDGAGIYNSGTLELTDSIVSNNNSTHLGGGIYNQGTARLSGCNIDGNLSYVGAGLYNLTPMTLDNCDIQNNEAAIDGGGISNYSKDLVISNTSIAWNTAVNKGGGIFASGAFNHGTGKYEGVIHLTDSTIQSNTTSSQSGGAGGGIYVALGEVWMNGGSVTGNATGRFGTGGGVYINGHLDNGKVWLSNTMVVDNDSGVRGFGGGGIFITTVGELRSNGGAIQRNSASNGGGILNNGFASLTKSMIDGNIGYQDGGGIKSNGRMIITNSTVIDNVAASNAGGIYSSSHLEMVNSTVSSNYALKNAGGILNYCASLESSNLTIVNNSADSDHDGNGIGGGLLTLLDASFCLNAAQLESAIRNTIIAGNSAPSDPDCSGPLLSEGYNLIQAISTGCPIGGDSTGNLMGVNPRLGRLQGNGGATLTHALLPGSPALDAGNPNGCRDQDGALLATDQRNFPRPVGRSCDIGSYESETPLSVYLPFIAK